MELNGKHRSVEGIGHHIAGVSEQIQKLCRAGVQNLPGFGMNFLPDAAQLYHRQASLLMQLRDIGRQRAGAADAVTQDIPAGGIVRRVVGHGGPLVRSEQQGGIQHHRHIPAGRLADNLTALRFPDGKVGEAVQIAFQLRLHPVGDSRDPKGRRVGNAPFPGKDSEKHRVETAVREDLRIPDLVAAGQDQIIGQFRVRQRVKTIIVMRGDAEMIPAELFKPAVALCQSLVVEGGVGVVGGGTKAGRPFEQGVILINEIVHDLAVPAEAFHGPFRGCRLKQSAIMMNMVKCDKSRFQRNNSLSVTSDP